MPTKLSGECEGAICVRHLMIIGTTVLFAILSATAEMVPFVIPLDQNPSSAIATKPQPITVNSPRIVVRKAHFAIGRDRVRIWGVNNSFAANIPTHKDAERLAARMGAAGINSVRFHHMDTAPYPRGILDPQDPMKFSAEALDRMDYFVDQLARNGIYANINLHVGRAASKVLKLPDPITHYDKIVGIFTPELIRAQKQYARDLLDRVNKSRNKRYADDPAVAFVEITNEDSLFMWGAVRDLKALPDFYQQILRTRYAVWLKAKYGTTGNLRRAWSQGSEPLGQNILAVDSIPKWDSRDKGWRLEQHNGCAAALERKTGGILRINIAKADDTGWHLQVKQTPLNVKAGRYYTLSFRARADEPRSISYGVGQDAEPWGNLGLSGSARLSTEWVRFETGFVALKDDETARLSLSVSGNKASVEVADVSLAAGGREGLLAEESIERANIVLFAGREVETRTIDRYCFLADTEKAYFDEMYGFLKKDLGVKSLITGTIAFGPCGLYGQGGMDYVDSHAYWQHPDFPGKPWDPANWIVEQKAMVDEPDNTVLPRLAVERMAGRPYTVSEYNHPAPNDFQAECVPVIAAYAALQDWDGIWFYTYSHSNEDMDRTAYNSFFDVDANSAKWGFMRAGAAIFRGNGIPALRRSCEIGIGDDKDALTSITRFHMQVEQNPLTTIRGLLKETGGTLGLGSQIKLTFSGKNRVFERETTDEPVLSWTRNEKRQGTFHASGLGGSVLISHAMKDGPVSLHGLEINAPSFAALTVTPLDGLPLADSKKVLVAACGRCENKDMVFSADRRTVGRNWGKAPVEIETIVGKVSLPPGNWTCFALNPDGTRGAKVALERTSAGQTVVALSPVHKTMWYLAEKDFPAK